MYTCNMISFVRFIVSVTLFCSFILQISANLLLWTHYEWNKTYISKVLCENKDIPDSCCKGKCFLKKQVSKQEELPNTANNTSKEQKSIKYQMVKDTFIDNIVYLLSKSEQKLSYFTFFSVSVPLQDYARTLEKPPQANFCI